MARPRERDLGRTERIEIRTTPEEKKIIESVAKKEDMNLADFVRMSVLLYCVFTGNTIAGKWLLRRGKVIQMEWIKEKLARFKGEKAIHT